MLVFWKIELALSWEMTAGQESFRLEAWMRADCRRGGSFVGAGFVSSCEIKR